MQPLRQASGSLQSTATARLWLPESWTATGQRCEVFKQTLLVERSSRGRGRKVRGRDGHCFVADSLCGCAVTAQGNTGRNVISGVWGAAGCRSGYTATSTAADCEGQPEEVAVGGSSGVLVRLMCAVCVQRLEASQQSCTTSPALPARRRADCRLERWSCTQHRVSLSAASQPAALAALTTNLE